MFVCVGLPSSVRLLAVCVGLSSLGLLIVSIGLLPGLGLLAVCVGLLGLGLSTFCGGVFLTDLPSGLLVVALIAGRHDFPYYHCQSAVDLPSTIQGLFGSVYQECFVLVETSNMIRCT